MLFYVTFFNIELSYNQNIALIFSFNDCRSDWNELQIGYEIVYGLENIVRYK